MSQSAPALSEIVATREQLGSAIVRTPLIRCAALEVLLGEESRIFGKCEFLQNSGTFKARGALASLLTLDPVQLERGVTAVSAGNHAIATAYAAKVCGTSAKVVMPRNAYACRVDTCRSFGAEIVLADNVHEAFDVAREIEEVEGRFFVHPFEGRAIAIGTGTVGLEILDEGIELDAVVVATGGGGLIGGIANALKQGRPQTRVIGVEPEGADSMHRSLAAGKPMRIDAVNTIADSLGAPYAQAYSFDLCRRFVDEWCLVDDLAIRRAMGILFRHQRIAVEPACAAALAALLGPLRDQLRGKSVALVFCGSNIDWASFSRYVLFDDDESGGARAS